MESIRRVLGCRTVPVPAGGRGIASSRVIMQAVRITVTLVAVGRFCGGGGGGLEFSALTGEGDRRRD